jgi:phytoene desaturase
MRHDVVVVEAADVVGGMLGRRTSGPFGWDTGPTSITLPAALRDLFLKTGQPLETVVDLEPLQPLAHCRFADGTRMDLANTGVVEVAAGFDAALGGRAGEDWRRFHDYAAQIWAVTRGPFVETPQTALRDIVRLSVRHPRQVRPVLGLQTLRDVGERFFSNERQRVLLDHYATRAGADPRRAPGALAVLPYVEQTFRGWSVRGGMRHLVDAVHDRAVARGAVMHTGVPVVAVTTAAGRVDGVRLGDGRHLAADVVVSDVDVGHLYDDLLAQEPSRRQLTRSTPSSSTFTLLLGLRGRTPGVRRHTVLFPREADAELDAVFGTTASTVREPTIDVHVSHDPADAPVGGEAWTIRVPAPRHGDGPGAIDWTTEGRAAGYGHQLIERLAARGVDVRDRIAVAEHRSPADIEQAVRAPGGAAYGRSLDGRFATFRRPANRSPVRGLFLVGGSAHPGAGIPLVTMSAALVADMVGRA